MAKSTRPRAKKGSGPKYYFTDDTEAAIILYNQTEDPYTRNQIYNTRIKKSFDKLVENLIHTFKFYHFDVPYEDVKHEVVAFLNEKITNYVKVNGKAFSYFSIVGKHYLIAHNNANYKKSKQRVELDYLDERRSVINEEQYSDYQELLNDFFELFVAHYTANLTTIFTAEADIAAADSIIEIFRIRKSLEIFNKKAIYILVRERSGVRTSTITRVMHIIKSDFAKKFANFQKYGIFN